MARAQLFEAHGHHPVPTYVASAFWLAAVLAAAGALLFGWNSLLLAVLLLAGAVVSLIYISRDYTVRLQDRIILLEMKVRCAEVLPAGDDAQLAALSPKQIVALRFASDEELGTLLARAARERLSPTEIKRAVSRWRPDYLRT